MYGNRNMDSGFLWEREECKMLGRWQKGSFWVAHDVLFFALASGYSGVLTFWQSIKPYT